jgi:hypothetical protein
MTIENRLNNPSTENIEIKEEKRMIDRAERISEMEEAIRTLQNPQETKHKKTFAAMHLCLVAQEVERDFMYENYSYKPRKF